MELRHLRYFETVVNARSFARAASLLRVAQPALSRQIRDLEREIDAPLLVRERLGVRPTEQGESVRRSAHEALRSLAELVTNARLARRGLLGHCRLAIGPVPLLGDRVGATLAAMRKRLPGVDLDVREIPSPEHARLLRAGAVDIAIGASAGSAEPGIDVSVFYRDPLDSAAVPMTHMMAHRSHVSAAELRNIPVLVLSRRTLPHVMAPTIAALRDRGFGLIREIDNITTINAQVIAGRGWALVPHSQRGGRPSDGYRVLPIDDLRLPFAVTLSLREHERSPLVLKVACTLQALSDRSWRPLALRDVDVAEPEGNGDEAMLHLGLELRHLRAFVTLLDEGHVAAAAHRLGLSQSALTRRLADLSRMLGVELVERTERRVGGGDGDGGGRGGIVATHVGEVLERSAREILSTTDAVAERAHQARRGIRGTIRIGLVSPAMGTIVAPLMAALARDCADLEIVLHACDTTEQPRALEGGAIDIGIAHSLRGLLDDVAIDGIQLWEDRLDMVMLPADHRLAGRKQLRAADLQGEPAIFPHPHWNRAFYDQLMVAFESLGLVPTIAGTCFSLRTMWSLAANGVGWMIGAHSQRAAPPPGLVAVPLEGLDIPWGFDLIWRRGERHGGVLDAIRAIRSTELPRWSELPGGRGVERSLV